MTNIWADSYKEIRKPFFDTESLEEERAKRDYDGDGQIESGAKEYRGAVHNAIQKKKGGKPDGQDTSSVKEAKGYYDPMEDPDFNPHEAEKKRGVSGKNNPKGGKPVKEEYIDEAQVANRDPEKYEREQDKKYAPVRGEKRPMPPRGHKDREAFEKWYRTNVREETLVEVEKKLSADKKVDVMKGGKNKVVINPAIREEVEEWVSELVEEGYDLSEFTWEDMTEIYEAVELDEGHGSRTSFKKQSADERSRIKTFGSNYTPHKNYDPQANRGQGQILRPKQAEKQRRKSLAKSAVGEEYELDEGTADMPPRGDAETVNVTNPQLASAKRRAAQTQIAADMARIKLQRTSAMTKESVDSIVEYLSQRNDAFENLEEAVFDPKRTRMRPASERTARVMTAAQRTAAKKEAERVAAIHSKGETVLAGMRTQGKRGKVKTTPDAKPAPPEANRTVKGRYDKLAKAASEVLKKTQR